MTSVFWILLAGFLVKAPALFQPFVGHFASYQSGYAMFADRMIKDFPSSVIFPRIFQLMDGQPALHLTLYPLGAVLAALGATVLGGSIDFWGRLHSALFMLASGWLLYKIALERFGKSIATLSVFIFTFSPMVLISGIGFQNEASAVFFLLAAYWVGRSAGIRNAFFSGLFFSVAIVLRLHFALFLPVLIAQLWQSQRDKGLLAGVASFTAGLAIPAGAWFGIVFYGQWRWPEQVFTSVGGQADEVGIFYHPVLRQAQFYQRLFEIFTGFWLTPILLVFFLLGLMSWDNPRRPSLLWTACALATIVIFPVKVFAQPFYLVGGLPAAAILTACALNDTLARLGKWVIPTLLAAFVLASMRYYIPPAFSAMQSGVSIPAIGRQVQNLTQPDDRLVTWHGSQDLLYYCKRFGWVLSLQPERWGKLRKNRVLKKRYTNRKDMLEDMRAQGAAYLVIADMQTTREDPDFWDYVQQHYKKVEVSQDSFLLFDLRRGQTPSQNVSNRHTSREGAPCILPS